jgi:hypothetical protein
MLTIAAGISPRHLWFCEVEKLRKLMDFTLCLCQAGLSGLSGLGGNAK